MANKLQKGINDLKTWCEQNDRMDLLLEWDYENNDSLIPSDIYKGSSQSVWWKCLEGHKWSSRITHRTRGIGCPFCSGHRVITGKNDLATVHPGITNEWNYVKNDPLTPDKICASSGKNVWWKCERGHEWEASPNARIRKRSGVLGCPYCANRRVLKGYNDLATVNPELVSEWHPTRNGTLTPYVVGAGTAKKVWWQCEKGHEWQAVVTSRTGKNHSGCPYCSNKKVLCGYNDLATTNPQLCEEWDYEKNGIITPCDVTLGSGKRIWWRCKKGHSWQTSISTRATGIGCPYCSGRFAITGVTDLMSVNPELCKEWDYEKNKNRKDKYGRDISTPDKVSARSSQKVWWKCEFGHEWETTISNRASGRNCPFCSRSGSSMPEQGIAYYLEKVCKVEQRVRISGNEIDVYLPDYKIGIEYDGKYYHVGKAQQESQKALLMNRKGIFLFRIKESDVNCVINDEIIKFDGEGINSNYAWALKTLFSILCVLTNNDVFNSIRIDLDVDSLKIRERFNLYKKKNSFAYNNPQLASEWNVEKNGKLKPEMFFSGSRQKVWWMCSQGHEWRAEIVSRVNGCGCPYCSNKRVLVGYNDLSTTNPDVAAEWHPLKNGELTPVDFTSGSNRKVWWTCSKGHEWQTIISNRSKGSGCPYCSGAYPIEGKTDLLSTHPQIATEWNYDKNRSLKDKLGRDVSTPNKVSAGSEIDVWWKCSNGHEWQAPVMDRKIGSGCPYCSGKRVLVGFNDLSTTNPEVALEWNYEKNGDLTPNDVVAGSNKKVWWRCNKGHEWMTTVSHRTDKLNRTRCPYCYGGVSRSVICVETGIVYNNMTEAVNATGATKANIVHSCKNKNRTSGGYHWKYVDEV